VISSLETFACAVGWIRITASAAALQSSVFMIYSSISLFARAHAQLMLALGNTIQHHSLATRSRFVIMPLFLPLSFVRHIIYFAMQSNGKPGG
jgi:hypothetical protein